MIPPGYVALAFAGLLALYAGWHYRRDVWDGLCWIGACAAAVGLCAWRRWRGEKDEEFDE